jgi:rhodanese-related sulfurtransferase
MKPICGCGFLLVFITVISLFSGCRSGNGVQDISPAEAQKFIQDNITNTDFLILDVRTPGEFSSGHLHNATNVDYNSNDFEAMVDKMDKNKTYLVYCLGGNRSSSAASTMKARGFKSVKNMSGGISAWSQQNLPLE